MNAPDAASLRLLSVNVGTARPLMVGGRRVLSAIGKQPVAGPVAVARLGLSGDEQADLSVHGGLDKAVYAYPAEHLSYWQARRREQGVSLWDELLPPGYVGENLTLEGLLESQVWVGDELHFPGCVLRVTAPREPCYKFNAAMGFNTAVKAMALSGFCGFYLAVDVAGTLQAGESFELVPGPRHMGIAERFQTKVFKHLR